MSEKDKEDFGRKMNAAERQALVRLLLSHTTAIQNLQLAGRYLVLGDQEKAQEFFNEVSEKSDKMFDDVTSLLVWVSADDD